MDLSFFRRAQTRFASRSAARLDYGVLVATLAAMQSATAAARSVRVARAEEHSAAGNEALVELILGGAGWREAARAQGGCFSPAQAGRTGYGL